MSPVFFALLVEDDGLPGFGPMTPAMKERLIILGALLFVTGIILMWVLVIRKQRRRNSSSSDRRRHRRRKSSGPTAAEGLKEIKQLVRERQRHRRREHRPRNPTLAETGGLPPPRSDQESGPPAAPTAT